jgi:hypothetical protein
VLILVHYSILSLWARVLPYLLVLEILKTHSLSAALARYITMSKSKGNDLLELGDKYVRVGIVLSIINKWSFELDSVGTVVPALFSFSLVECLFLHMASEEG